MLTSDAGYLELLADANRSLASMHLELRRLKYLFDNEWYLALVNKLADDVAKAGGSGHTFPQIQLLRNVLEEIATDPDAQDGKGSIGSTQALYLDFMQTQATQSAAVSKAKLTMADKRALMDSFIKDGWLICTPGGAGRYSIGPRSFLELHEFLLSLDLPQDTRAAWQCFL
ncbi:hypothetical protein WJX81_004008 [Elliptochloris bilobata]|uniref:Non-structural maintenance of chromosomes element 1 homolog n=1 Tax=Elliptochloris bilobata TaxID=381761 RepID=A0AAW1RQ96_9CHLO